jgi:hypothetical protein
MPEPTKADPVARTRLQPKSAQLPIQQRAAVLESFNAEARTVELVWTTGATVKRSRWVGWDSVQRYDETLSLDPAHVDLGRLNNGAPLLNTHGSYQLSDVLGVVEKAWIDTAKGEGRALVRFSDREDVAPIVKDVAAGIIRNVSVGYQVRTYEITETDGEVPKWLAVDWEPYELSLVPIGADAGAGTRAADQQTFPCDFVNRVPDTHNQEHETMKTPNQPGTEGAPGTMTAAEVTAAQNAATQAERARVQEIGTICRQAGLSDEQHAKFVKEGTAIDEVRKAALDAVAERAEQQGTQRSAVVITADETDKRRAAIENALLHRANPSRFQLDAGGRHFRSLTLMELARESLEASGEKIRGMSRMEIAGLALGLNRSGGYHTTSDFPNVLANVANKTLRMGYEAAPQTFRPWTRQSTAPDFKQISRTQLGDAPNLLKVGESGEIKRGTVGEGAEKYALATYARIVAVTRQTIINDDMGAFTRMPEAFGRAAADLESDVVWGVVIDNAAMADTIALFHADHGNLLTGAAISIDSMGKARAAMRAQKNLAKRPINVSPKFLLVPVALETLAEQYVTATTVVAAKSSDANPFAGKTQVLAEPRLDAASASNWYMAADPAQIDTIEYSYLEGSEGVYLETRVGWDVDGIELKARDDFAAKAIDWRGLVKNPH